MRFTKIGIGISSDLIHRFHQFGFRNSLKHRLIF
jgi:hypothetical protein